MADIVIEYKLIIIRNLFSLFILREVDIIKRLHHFDYILSNTKNSMVELKSP